METGEAAVWKQKQKQKQKPGEPFQFNQCTFFFFLLFFLLFFLSFFFFFFSVLSFFSFPAKII